MLFPQLAGGASLFYQREVRIQGESSRDSKWNRFMASIDEKGWTFPPSFCILN
jgi:hypothetical protein